ncbi:MAG: DUF6285 domain-containing protein [Anaerolineae bacterium]
MYDRPTLTELLQSARDHLETRILPLTRNTHHQLYFQTLVAINVMKIAEREYNIRPYHLRSEWTRLHRVMGQDMPTIDNDDDLEVAIQQANTRLCQRIRDGEFDTDYALFQHLKARTMAQLEVANPKFLQALHAEDAS